MSDIKKLLDKRKNMKKKRPTFLRQDSFRFKRLLDAWRKPKGRHSKMRLQKDGKASLVNAGYRSPKDVRGLTSSGLRPVIVSNVKSLADLVKGEHGVVIGSGVGTKKRLEIIKEAEKKGLTICNVKDTKAYVDAVSKKREEKKKVKDAKKKQESKTEKKAAPKKDSKKETKENKSKEDLKDDKEKARLEAEKVMIKK